MKEISILFLNPRVSVLIFLFLVFLSHTFHGKSYYFLLIEFWFLVIVDCQIASYVFATLIVKLRHTFSRLVFIGTTFVFGSVRFGSSALYLKYLTFSFCSRLFVDAICNNWTTICILQITTSWLKISMVEKLISKELDNPFGFYDNSLLMGHHPQGYTARGRTHLGHNGCYKYSIKSMSTRHQSPDILHQLHQAAVTSQWSSRHQVKSPVI